MCMSGKWDVGVKWTPFITPCEYFRISTHWGRDKMATILQITFSDAFSSIEMCGCRRKNSLKYVSEGPIYNNPDLVQIMAWHRISGPMMAQFIDAYMRHSASVITVFIQVFKKTFIWRLFLKSGATSHTALVAERWYQFWIFFPGALFDGSI